MRKKITILKTMLLAIMMLVGSGNVWGQQLAIYEFTGTSTADNQFNSVTSQPTNATFSNFTRNGVTWVSTADLFNSSTSWGSAINTAKYQTFTITPSSNYKMTLSQISFLQSRTSAGATNWSIRSSVDSYAADIQTGTSSTTGTTVNNSLSGADFTDRTTAITFRIYAWGGSSTGNWKIDNLSVNGIITSQGTPDILLADIGTQVTAANINQGATTQVLSKFQLGITTASASLSGMTCTTSGSYITADITNLKVRYSVDATLDAADATISTYTTPGIAGVKTFPSFVTQSIAMDATGYIFITADIAAGAIHNNTIAVNAISTSNLTFSSGNKTGTASAGGTQTIKDATPPTVTTYSPIDGNTAVTANQSLTLTFNENIQAGTSGDFVIYNTAGIFETIPYNDSRITYATNTVTINPTGTFSLGANYYVQIGNTAISDIAGNLYAGISTTTTWNFTTIAPVVTSVTSSNLDGTYKIGDLITVNVSFSDTVNVTGSPYLLLNMVGTDRQAAYSTGSGTSILNFTYTIQSTDAAADLDYVTTSSLALNSGTINSTDGIAATRTLATPGAANSLGNNKAIVIDAVAPTVSTYSPTDGNTTVLINQNLVFTFNENVKAGTTGSIVIYNSGGTVFETIPYNDDRITFSTNTVTINPIGSLGYSSDYYVQISLGAITDNFDNVYLGISNATTWNFTTECGPVSFPYSQTFTTYPPTCWTEATGLLAAQSTLTGTTSGWIADGYANSGTTGSARLNIYGTTSKEWMITPSIDLGTTTDYQLEFDVALTAYGATTSPAITGTDDKFAVVISTDNGTTWTSTNNLKLWDNAGSSNVYNNLTPTGTHVTISLANYTGIVKIGFYGESTATNADNDLFIDNVAVSVIATCVSPMDVVSSNVTASTATISWTASTSTPTNGYQYELRTSGTAGSGATGLVTSGTTLAGVVSASISGLSDNTSYAVYVRADCSAGDFSVWSTLYNFTTNNVSVPTATAATSLLYNGFTANWDATTGALSYKLDVSSNSLFNISNLSESFVGCSAGSITTPDTNDLTASSLDTYLQTSNWTGSKVYQSGGSVKIGSTSALGYITTKTIDLSANSGNAILTFDLEAYSGDATGVQVFHSADGTIFTQVGSDITAPAVMATQTISITGGTVNSKIKIAAATASKNRFFLDNVSVLQNMNVTGYNDLAVNGTSQIVTGLSPITTYYYRVRAVGGNSTSANSNVKNVLTLTNVPTALVNTNTNLSVSTLNGKIQLNAAAGETVNIYNAIGQQLLSKVAVQGLNTIAVATRGVVIVKVGNKVAKVIL